VGPIRRVGFGTRALSLDDSPPQLHLHRISIQTPCRPRILEQQYQNSSELVRIMKVNPADSRIQIHPPKSRRVLNREMRINQFNQRNS